MYWIKFSRIGSARIAKQKLDNWSFYGKALHVCYAPEYETVLETRDKIAHRKNVISQKTIGTSYNIILVYCIHFNVWMYIPYQECTSTTV